jgi:lysyl-tRNA synthetase class 2
MTPVFENARKARAARAPALKKRARIIQAIRAYFIKEGYLEVETPVRIPAPAPETHIDAPQSGTHFLHTSPELAMKRLVAAGYGRIFQICRVFREGERGRNHLPEFTMLEWYASGSDYNDLMVECEGLLKHIAQTLGLDDGTLRYGGMEINLSVPGERVGVHDAFARYTDVTADRALAEGDFDLLMAERIEPRLGMERATFLIDYPIECASLAAANPEDPTRAQRVELYLAGTELANGFTELTDPAEQRARFEKERAARSARGATLYPLPEPFLRDLEYMPPTAGMALGIDRLVMLFANVSSIDDVVAFTFEEL